ncbi:unnamed protein product [Calicophoron daubneyi]|uniref:Putative rRNA methyltransferase n=1 Tax=Calicophoron daubneyi TaxID=300641 RepID=A0AAV2TXI3_CALDB
MAKKTKVGKARKDRFYYLAKETGYRSRAAFKLIQLNRRFNFLGGSKVLIDLCAAPGGWLQVASKEMPVASQIIGVDLVPIQAIPRVKTFIADITTEKCRQYLRSELAHNKADVVLHDGAPNVGTAWSIDEYSQANLCLQAFSLATEFLRKGGWFITKVFRSRDYEPLKWVLSQFFRTVRPVKPEASRLESAEIFLVGQSYKAPDRIDRRFLDPHHVFGEVELPKDRATMVSNLLKECKKRKAEGYEDGDTLYHELLVSDFLRSSDPLESLAKANKIVLDVPEVRDHALTTPSIKSDIQDILVLGKADIRNILKWRTKINKALESTVKPSAVVQTEAKPDRDAKVKDNIAGGDADVEAESAEELQAEEEVQRILHEEQKEQKKRLKRVRRAKMKLAERLVLKMEHPGDRIEENDDELFSLSTLHNLVDLEQDKKLCGDTSATGADKLARAEEETAVKAIRRQRAEEAKLAIEGGARAHFERRGDDNAYDYAENPEAQTGARDDLYLSSDEEVGADNPKGRNSDGSSVVSESEESMNSSGSADEDEPVTKRVRFSDKTEKEKSKRAQLPEINPLISAVKQRNPLLVDLDDSEETAKQKRKIDAWMESDEMKSLLGFTEHDESESETSDLDHEEESGPSGTKEKKLTCNKNKVALKPVKVDDPSTKSCVYSGPAADSLAEKLEVDPSKVSNTVQRLKRLRRPLTPEERALSVRLIRSAKSRRELVESAYNQMQFFDEPSDLPDWFVEDEQKHMRKPLPLTRQEVSIDRPTTGRTLTKAEEAKARKKARLAKRLKRIRKRAEEISDDVPESEKWQQIKQMYKKAGLLANKRRPFHMIVNTKAGARNQNAKIPKGAKVKIVDRRMKADARGMQRGSKTGNGRAGRKGRPVNLRAHKPRRGGRR